VKGNSTGNSVGAVGKNSNGPRGVFKVEVALSGCEDEEGEKIRMRGCRGRLYRWMDDYRSCIR